MHLFCEKYGWNIEYVMNLTRRQINCMLDGMIEYSNLIKDTDESIDNNGKVSSIRNSKKGYNVIKKGDKSVNKIEGEKGRNLLNSIIGIPGVKIGKNAAKKLDKLYKREMEQKNVN